MSLDVLLGQPFLGDRLLHRQVVGVADPTDGVGVLAVAGRELGGTPAGDWAADELLRGDQGSEEYEDDDVMMTSRRSSSKSELIMRMMTVYCLLRRST